MSAAEGESKLASGPLVAASAVALLAALGGLTYLRHDANRLEQVFGMGDILDTHRASGLTALELGATWGRLELAIIAVVVALPLSRTARSARASLAAFAASMVVFTWVYLDSIARHVTRIAGHLYVHHCDDALISMRYARNFAEGRGLVYSAGEAVDGFTNPLWTAIMVIPHAIGMHEGVTTLFIVLLGGLLLIATAALVRAALVAIGTPPVVQLLMALLVVFDSSAFEFSVIGLETPLLCMASALVVAGRFLDRERWIWVGIATLTLARADGVVVAALLVLWLVLDEASVSGESLKSVLRRRWKRLAWLVAVASALVAWRLAIYGHPAPNTAYLKVYSLADRLKTGVFSYGVRGLVMYGAPTAFVLWSAAVHPEARRARRLLLPVIALWLYAIYVGGDAFPYLRFVGPVTPVLWAAVGMAASATWDARARPTNAALFVGLALLAPVKSELGVLGSTIDRGHEVRSAVIAAKTLERNVPANASIATFFAGLSYYAPKHRFIDVLGKADAHIAHQTTVYGTIPGHNKFDFRYVYDERKPEVTFTSLPCDQVERSQSKPRDALDQMIRELPAFHFHPALYQMTDPTFRELYAPYRVILREGDAPWGHPIGCWFVRRDSGVPIVWQVAYE